VIGVVVSCGRIRRQRRSSSSSSSSIGTCE
jgi:hypothetical protein